MGIPAKGYIERRPTDWLVGARGTDLGSQYVGPAARVSYDKDWLYIVTDDYEGNAMLNIEALPFLRRALTQIAKEIASKKRPEAKE